MTDGVKNGGFYNSEANYGLSYADTDVYGSSVGSYSSVSTRFGSEKSVGITLDASKSGIICEADSNIVLVIKY